MANPKKSKVSGKSKGGKHKERKPSQQVSLVGVVGVGGMEFCACANGQQGHLYAASNWMQDRCVASVTLPPNSKQCTQ